MPFSFLEFWWRDNGLSEETLCSLEKKLLGENSKKRSKKRPKRLKFMKLHQIHKKNPQKLKTTLRDVGIKIKYMKTVVRYLEENVSFLSQAKKNKN